MVIDVVFLEHNSTEPFRLPLGPTGQPLAWREEEHDAIQEMLWDRCTNALWRHAADRVAFQLEVFLCLRDTPLSEDLLDAKFVRQTIEWARRRSLGANVYVVVDKSFDLSNGDLHRQTDYWQEWFVQVHAAGATDVLQWPFEDTGLKPLTHENRRMLKELRLSAARSQQRQKALLPGGEWQCFCRRESGSFLKSFLKPFTVHTEKKPDGQARNLVTVVDHSRSNLQQKLLDEALLTAGQGRHLVARSVPTELTAYVEGLRDKGVLRIADFAGVFELRYLLHLLKDEVSVGFGRGNGLEKEVVVNSPTIFQPVSLANTGVVPTLLITSSFNPNDAEHCLAAAEEIGELTRQKPAHVRCMVHPGVTSDNLPTLLTTLPKDLTAWVHLGHGNQKGELQESRSGRFHAPGHWLDCFRGGGRSLALAVFGACHSEAAANTFALGGAGMTVGFSQELPTHHSRLLSARVVGAALRSMGAKEEMLRAFRAGCDALHARHLAEVQPTAFVSVWP